MAFKKGQVALGTPSGGSRLDAGSPHPVILWMSTQVSSAMSDPTAKQELWDCPSSSLIPFSAGYGTQKEGRGSSK